MKARVTACLVFTLTASLGCGNGDSADTAGGTTGDFTGDAVDCDSVRLEGQGDEPALGFSVTEILAATEGRFDVPVQWSSMCDEPARASSACDTTSAFVEMWAGNETTVHVTIMSDGSEAEVRHPTDAQPVCAQGMFIPVELRLESDDGLLDETADVTAWSECGTQSSVNLMLPIESAGGALAPPISDLPPSGWVEITLGFFGDRMWFDLYVVPSEASPVLTSDLPPFGERTHDVPRTSVERQDGTTLPDESVCKIAY